MSANRYIVVVDDSLLSGTVRIMAGEASAGERAAMPDRETELRLRRAMLSGLAESIHAGTMSGASDRAASVSGALFSGVAAGVATEDSGQEAAKVTILEGIGAIIFDDADPSVLALENTVGLTVIPDVEVPLSEPEPSIAQAAGSFWHLDRIGTVSENAAGRGILAGVLDTGIDADHPEFAGKTIYFAEFDETGRMVSSTPRDAGDHGTHVSSILAGNRAGVASAADLAVAAVLTLRDSRGRMYGMTSQIVAGFNWLVATQFRAQLPGVDLVNASLGGSGFNAYLQVPVRNARRIGIPFIAAIGNAGRQGAGNHGSPGNYPESLGVGASDPGDQVVGFSDWGAGSPPAGPAYPVPHLSAPGVDVEAARPGGGFQTMSGTSMATPVVSGVSACRMAANSLLQGDPDALFADLQRNLEPLTANSLGNQGGAGRVRI